MSSSDLAVRVRGLGKSYTIAHQQGPAHNTLAEQMLDWVRHPLRRSAKETFWALRDVEFDIPAGEVVGIVGRNGAGKSTLLKILSRITEPTAGTIDLVGRVGSLLEVGTGFHPELTGRENVFLNGAILGMTKAEIRRQFDAIVDFAGVEQFLDTPVKRYSSGMYVRLAFAVAAHLDSDILIVDEVLAVGDATFQQKCLSKMESVGQTGRTVLFVSHSMAAVARLCRSAIYLRNGRLEYAGDVAGATRLYLSEGSGLSAERTWPADRAPGDDIARLRAVRATDATGRPAEQLCINDPIYIEVEYDQTAAAPEKPLTVSVHLITEGGVIVFASNDFENTDWYATPRRRGTVRTRCQVPADLLAEGSYTVLAAVCTYDPNNVHAVERDAVSFQGVEDSDRVGVRGEFAGDWPGIIRPRLAWEAEYVS